MIDIRISSLTTVVGKTDVGFMESADIFLSALPTLPTQLNLAFEQINTTVTYINQKESSCTNLLNLTTNYKLQAEKYKDETLAFKTATETAYQNTVTLIENTDISGTAGYTIDAVDDIVDDIELEQFLNFNLN